MGWRKKASQMTKISGTRMNAKVKPATPLKAQRPIARRSIAVTGSCPQQFAAGGACVPGSILRPEAIVKIIEDEGREGGRLAGLELDRPMPGRDLERLTGRGLLMRVSDDLPQ